MEWVKAIMTRSEVLDPTGYASMHPTAKSETTKRCISPEKAVVYERFRIGVVHSNQVPHGRDMLDIVASAIRLPHEDRFFTTHVMAVLLAAIGYMLCRHSFGNPILARLIKALIVFNNLHFGFDGSVCTKLPDAVALVRTLQMESKRMALHNTVQAILHPQSTRTHTHTSP